MTKSQLVVDNVAVHQEINYQTNADGSPQLTNPTETLNNLVNTDTGTGILVDLLAEISLFYSDTLADINADESSYEDPSWSNRDTDFFTNLKQIKIRRLQTQCKLMCFELKRLTAECTKIVSLGVSDLPDAPDNRYPSSQRSYNNPNAGW